MAKMKTDHMDYARVLPDDHTLLCSRLLARLLEARVVNSIDFAKECGSTQLPTHARILSETYDWPVKMSLQAHPHDPAGVRRGQHCIHVKLPLNEFARLNRCARQFMKTVKQWEKRKSNQK